MEAKIFKITKKRAKVPIFEIRVKLLFLCKYSLYISEYINIKIIKYFYKNNNFYINDIKI